MRLRILCHCGAELEVESDGSVGTPTWEAMLVGKDKWLASHFFIHAANPTEEDGAVVITREQRAQLLAMTEQLKDTIYIHCTAKEPIPQEIRENDIKRASEYEEAALAILEPASQWQSATR